ncbi:MAG: hypothetical protein H7123_02735 [Thermoleophilia bacterium]|nr:hypothetical protein [Thermoleophilia bacterium]
MSEHASAWKTLVDEWVARERELYPEAPVQPATVKVRDSIEIGDQAFVLISYDVDVPWPTEEDTLAEHRGSNTAVLQAKRVRTPWVEEDATRALAQLTTTDGQCNVSEHVLGTRRAFSGFLPDSMPTVTLHFDNGESSESTVVDGWFLAVVPEEWRLIEVAGTLSGEAWRQGLVRTDLADMISTPGFARSAGQAMYFSPLDIRNVMPVVRWERADNVVVVATSIEQYDDGGVVRLRIDGVRADDDLFTQWPKVSIDADGLPLASAICGEYGLADTVSIDVGFRPWTNPDDGKLTVSVRGLRGARGPVEKIVVSLATKRIHP